MSVYKYMVTLPREDNVEEGTVVASDEEDAKRKLLALDLKNPRLRKLKGMSAFVKQFSADVR